MDQTPERLSLSDRTGEVMKTPRSTLHYVMRKGKPYSEIIVQIALRLEQDNNDGYFTIKNFRGINPVDWRKVMNKLRAAKYVERVKKAYESKDRVTVYRDCGLYEAFKQWSEKHDWKEYLY